MNAIAVRFILCLAFSSLCVAAVEPSLSLANVKRLTFDQRIGEQISPTIAFTDDDGRSVRLIECVRSGPIIVALGYYECPMLCNLVLNGLVHSLQEIKTNMAPGLSVIFVSVDPKESAQLAARKKRTYLKRLGLNADASSWHFLTGDTNSIGEIAEEIGFHYAYDPINKQYAHPSGIIVLTPNLKISKYFFGVNYPAAELAGALKQAAAGQNGAPTSPILMLCSKFMTLTGIHSAAVMRSVRALGILSIFGVIALVVVSGKRGKGGAA
jgi:protein SCO1/2